MNLLETVTPIAASGMFRYAWTMIAVPGVVAAFLLLAGRVTDKWGHLLATLASLYSFSIGACLFGEMLGREPGQRAVTNQLWTLFEAGSWKVDVSLLVDQLSILFVLLITGVGSLIHIYSIGYMAHDERRRRFFAYLNLFVAAMLTLVLGDNYLITFFGWEGVGLASFLLISFWQHKTSAALAGKKAFVMNRVGDLGLTMAIFTMLSQLGSSAFVDVNEHATKLSPFWATVIGLLLLVAACGKSAQFPLQAWLLDAMEGPTPVSALIHAATMVTAGVYLVVRSHHVYAQTETAQIAVAVIGTITLLYGAWIGTSKDDIKKVLAGSTMSQIGYMMLAAGLGPIGAAFAIFHLITHGFFKANMFLGAGSVMHGMSDDVDMRHFGALRKAMPITFLTFAMGYLAIIGFPFTSGYFSKDHIIEAAFEKSPVFGSLALLGALVTAFYMTRLMMMTFFGEKRWLKGVHPHESPLTMTIPLMVLAVLSIVAGALMNNWIGEWLEPATGAEVHHTALTHITPIGMLTMGVVALGVFCGWFFFRKEIPSFQPATNNVFAIAGRNDLYGDHFNEAVFMRPGQKLVEVLDHTDRGVVDGAVMGTATALGGLSTVVRKLQNGYVRSYALTMVAGAILVGLALILGQLA
ncbi:NADH dehydrogenase subunit L [Luteococcus japonicus]|uniref:NADH-ubiquinone oxidoreductase chain L n=3 Tax=Propionibacteriaceae TaxID=31957 RepID=A0A1R4J2Y4_9ACTN|nr:NADH dehydrogenase subunit L [Luteococcus japonicus]SJN26407.1 NADH-ubiquinone oxidoreductase chain L [Luteococcus japonicus LSP_Lj1]